MAGPAVTAQAGEEDTMVGLLISISAALGCVALGVGVFVLGKPLPPAPRRSRAPSKGSEKGGAMLA
jgi:hypothetical protein